jgi:hypothetical protein
LEADRRQVIGQAAVDGTKWYDAKIDKAIADARLLLEEKNLGVDALGRAIKNCATDADRLIVDRQGEYGAGLRAQGDELAQRADKISVLQQQLEADRLALVARWERLLRAQGITEYRRDVKGAIALDDHFQPKAG